MKTDAYAINVTPASGPRAAPSDKRDEIATFLAQRAARGANAERVATFVAATCREIENALTPIIGARGVAALLNRSVHMAGQTHAWLNEVEAGLPATVDLQALIALLARQSPATAAAGGSLLLHSFREVLVSLIGSSLAERLLRTAWAPFMGSESSDAWP